MFYKTCTGIGIIIDFHLNTQFMSPFYILPVFWFYTLSN